MKRLNAVDSFVGESRGGESDSAMFVADSLEVLRRLPLALAPLKRRRAGNDVGGAIVSTTSSFGSATGIVTKLIWVLSLFSLFCVLACGFKFNAPPSSYDNHKCYPVSLPNLEPSGYGETYGIIGAIFVTPPLAKFPKQRQSTLKLLRSFVHSLT